MPGAPTGLSPAYGNSQVLLAWTAPADDGGSDITGYVAEYRAVNGTGAPWMLSERVASDATAATVTGLANGQAYEFRVYAENVAGTGAPSGIVVATPYPVPGPPGGLSAAPAPLSVTLRWDAPAAADGGAPVDDYIVEYRDASAGASEWDTHYDTGAALQTSSTITGLANGQVYEFRVYAVNDAGRGIPSDVVRATPRGVPSAPLDLSSDPVDSGAVLRWSPPADDGGAPITDYIIEYRNATGTAVWVAHDGGGSANASSTHATVTGLANGRAYEFRVYAVNEAGTGAPSGIASVTPGSVPGSPAGLAAAPAPSSVALSWNAPADAGAVAAVTGYVVEYRDASMRGNSGWNAHNGAAQTASTFADVRGLKNGLAYEFRVYAVNDIGRGVPSDAVRATPLDVPGAPEGLAAVHGSFQVYLEWRAPADDGGGTIRDYVIEYRPASGAPGAAWLAYADGASDATAATVTGLANGQAYEFRVYAVNEAGRSAPSQRVTEIPHPVPGAPTNLAVAPAPSGVELAWISPAGGAENDISDYIAEYRSIGASGATPGQWMQYVDGASDTPAMTITGLVNGLAYEFRVYAVNDIGRGVPSDAVRATPLDVPGAPEGLAAVHGSFQVYLEWRAPADDGGGTIRDYVIEYRPASGAPGAAWLAYADGASDATAATVTGLANGQAYEFRVYAENEAGTGAPSGTVAATPYPVPGPPGGLAAAPAPSSVALAWIAPAGQGAGVSDYVIEYRTAHGQQAWLAYADGASDATAATVTGLANGRAYEFRVYAVNDIGRGVPSDAVRATPRDVPGAPEGLAAVHGSFQVYLEWRAPADDGGGTIRDYVIEYRPASGAPGAAWLAYADGASDATAATVTGLENLAPYEFRVYAINEAGRSMPSDVVSETPHPVPGSPMGLVASPADSGVLLSWMAPAYDGGHEIESYAVEYRAKDAAQWITYDDLVIDTSVIVTPLINGRQYEFRVYAANDAGRGVPSAAIEATPRIPTGPDMTPPVVTPFAISPMAAMPSTGLADVVVRIPTVSDDTDAASDISIATNITGTWQSVTSDFVISLPVGVHAIHWRAADTAGNINTALQHAVVTGNAVDSENRGAPTLRINGPQSVTLATGDPYVEHGATCTGSDGRDIAVVVQGGDAVDIAAPGTYFVYYSCIDPAGGESGHAVRTVTVTADEKVTPPDDHDGAGAASRCR